MESRPDRDTYFMGFAQIAATRATCMRAHVGAVLVKDKRVIATGMNGAPSGLPQCNEVGCEIIDDHCVRTIHAETSILLYSAKHGIETSGATIYVTHFPCRLCQMALVNAGIKDVVYLTDYRIAEPPMLPVRKLRTPAYNITISKGIQWNDI